jgi:hypothetical protein
MMVGCVPRYSTAWHGTARHTEHSSSHLVNSADLGLEGVAERASDCTDGSTHAAKALWDGSREVA